jgi:hypothetical protein
LFVATAWISSTMIVRALRSMARLRSAVTIRNSDSGVVIKMSGGRLSMAARSAAAVSPVRTATRISGAVSPSLAATAAISASGASRFCWMSVASAFSGDTYTTCGPDPGGGVGGSFPSGSCPQNRSWTQALSWAR